MTNLRHGGNCSAHVVAFLLFNCFSLYIPRLHFLQVGELNVRFQYKDIKGSRVLIRARYFNGIARQEYVVNQIHMESWMKSAFESPHRPVIPKENYICPTANDCIFIAISASPFILSSPFPIPLRIFKGLPYSWAACTRARGVLCVRRGKRYKVYHARVSCIVKSSPLNAKHFDEVSATVTEWVWTRKTSSFFCFPATISTVITIILEGVRSCDSVFFLKCERIVLVTNKLLRFYFPVSL